MDVPGSPPLRALEHRPRERGPASARTTSVVSEDGVFVRAVIPRCVFNARAWPWRARREWEEGAPPAHPWARAGRFVGRACDAARARTGIPR